MAFTSKGSEAPEVIEIAAPDVHDYDAAYLERVNPKLSHHTKPHQFRIMKFGEQVLVHYRMWSTHKLWLPGEHTVQHDAPSAAFPEKKLPEKARSSRQKKKEAQQARKEERKGKRPRLVKSDDSELDDYDPADATGVYEEEHEVELSGLQGIQW